MRPLTPAIYVEIKFAILAELQQQQSIGMIRRLFDFDIRPDPNDPTALSCNVFDDDEELEKYD